MTRRRPVLNRIRALLAKVMFTIEKWAHRNGLSFTAGIASAAGHVFKPLDWQPRMITADDPVDCNEDVTSGRTHWTAG